MAENQKTVLLKRNEVAEIFGVTKVTIWDWTKKNILKAYKIANKVYYKQHEIEAALTQISGERE
jgi:predicted DNA-binding transcriptional regulator AlpA